MKKTFFIIVQLQFTVRYLLKTDIYKVLNELGHEIVILSPNGDDKEFIKQHSLKNVHFEKLELERYQKYYKKLLYKFFSQVRRLTLPSKNNISTIHFKEEFLLFDLKNFKLKSRLFHLFCIAISRLTRKFRFFLLLLNFIENLVYRKNYHKHLYQKYKPDAVILNDLGTVDASNFIMREARGFKVKIISLILSWDNLTAKGVGSVKPDYAVAWNQNMADELQNYHNIKTKNICIGGIPHFDPYAKSFSPIEQINTDVISKNNINKFIYFGTGAPAWFTGNVKTIEIILDFIKSRNEEKIKLVVRPHPAYLGKGRFNKELQEIIRISKDNRKYIYLNLTELIERKMGAEFSDTDQYLHEYFIRNCKILITSYSTLMLEAAIFNKPIINIGFDNLRKLPTRKTSDLCSRLTHLQTILSSNFTSEAKTQDDIFLLLKTYLNDNSIKEKERKKVFNKYINYNFGNAGSAIAQQIIRFIE
tara:strand:+ start:1276 stop:2700 length:1425 start_codon:yes stop_codon:yes gene_type:complete